MSKRTDGSVVATVHINNLDFPVGSIGSRSVRSSVLGVMLVPSVVLVDSPHDHNESARVGLNVE